MRKKIVAGNWKMNKTLEEGLALASEVVNIVNDEVTSEVTGVLCTPFVHLAAVSKITEGSEKVFLGAQNMSEHASGAYTGDISASMLQSVGASFVILGHSERREYHRETNAQLACRVDAALAAGLTPIFCCGESLEIREASTHVDFVTNQLKESLFHLEGIPFPPRRDPFGKGIPSGWERDALRYGPSGQAKEKKQEAIYRPMQSRTPLCLHEREVKLPDGRGKEPAS